MEFIVSSDKCKPLMSTTQKLSMGRVKHKLPPVQKKKRKMTRLL